MLVERLQKVRQKQQGIGLLELMLSLAVIAMLLIMATRYYATAHMGEQVNEAVGIVQALRGASAQWEAGQGDYTNISLAQLYSFGLLPADLNDNGAYKSDPWGGTIALAANSTTFANGQTSQILVTLNNVPTQACVNLAAKLGNQVANVDNSGCLTTAGPFLVYM